jgi:glycosyltransferase involved in cell wall biosynthesis
MESAAWASEHIVIDCGSEDATARIAAGRGARLFERVYDGYTRQVAFGVEQAANDWVLVLDADEAVTPELAAEIAQVLPGTSPAISGFDIPRHVFFLGRWIDHGGWYPDYQFRLFHRKRVTVIHREIHSSFLPLGESRHLTGQIHHYTYRTLFDFIARINRYTSFEVDNRLKEGRREVRWYNMLLNPFSYFLRMYFGRKGFLDGVPGLILALFSAFYSAALYAKLWEYRKCREEGMELPPITNREMRERHL